MASYSYTVIGFETAAAKGEMRGETLASDEAMTSADASEMARRWLTRAASDEATAVVMRRRRGSQAHPQTHRRYALVGGHPKRVGG